MATFETLGGTLDISSEAIVLDGNRLRRLKHQTVTNRPVLAVVVLGLLLGLLVSLGRPRYATLVTLLFGGAVAILVVKLLIARVRHGPPHTVIDVDHVTKASVKQPPLSAPILLVAYATPDGADGTAMVFLPHRWMAADAGGAEILATLAQYGVPTERSGE